MIRDTLTEMETHLAAATPRPWEVLGNDQGHPAGYEWIVWSPSVESEDDTGFVGGRGAMDETGIIDCSLWGKRDAALIAAAVNALPELLATAHAHHRLTQAVDLALNILGIHERGEIHPPLEADALATAIRNALTTADGADTTTRGAHQCPSGCGRNEPCPDRWHDRTRGAHT